MIILEPPALANRRVEQLRGDKPKSTTESPITPAGNREFLKMLDTPTRDSLLQRFKELEDETPQSKRRRCEQVILLSCSITIYFFYQNLSSTNMSFYFFLSSM